ncbi:MAG: polysaccharide deacetylase [Peptococcaceae bacterium]|nr:polysaccharide deacetylase [Peptococcaceae bacterium]
MEKHLKSCCFFAVTVFIGSLSMMFAAHVPGFSSKSPLDTAIQPDISIIRPDKTVSLSNSIVPELFGTVKTGILFETGSTPETAITVDSVINQRERAHLIWMLNLSMSSLSLVDVNGLLAPCLSDPDFNIFYDVPPSPEMNVYITFDDGPSEYMDNILDTLDEYGAVATFFLLEPRIRQYPDVVRRAFREGHALGSHGVTHKHNVFYQSTESIISEIDQTITALRDTTGVGSPLVRVPYGTFPNMTKKQLAILAEHGYKVWDWNIDSHDWKLQDGSFVPQTIQQLKKLREQGATPIVLLHDMKGTVAHFAVLLEYLRDNGYVFCTLDPASPGFLSW